MKLLEKYLTKTILSAIGLITLMLIGLQFFMLFVGQIGDLGKGDFNVTRALLFVLLQLPYQIYLFFPVASLLGALVGLGILANHSELIVMRAAGFSVGQIMLSVIKAALIVIVLVTSLGETIVPHLAQLGNNLKAQAISGGQTLTTAHGIWMRVNKNDFLSIGKIVQNNRLESIYQFHFNQQGALEFARKIGQLVYSNGVWQAYSIEETRIKGDKTESSQTQQALWNLPMNPLFLRLSSREPDEMTLVALSKYLGEGGANAIYALAFWQRLFQPLTTIVMMILAIPFIFGPLRSSTMGSKLVLGTSIGFGFYLMARFLGPFSQVYQWPPILAAIGPTLVFACLGLYLMRRVR